MRLSASASTAWPKVPFTEQMRDEGYTILCPQMAPIHFDLVKEVFRGAGYNFELLPSTDHDAVEAGLRYVNNDICYPSILVTGQIMEAIESGRYDLSKQLWSSARPAAAAVPPTTSHSSARPCARAATPRFR